MSIQALAMRNAQAIRGYVSPRAGWAGFAPNQPGMGGANIPGGGSSGTINPQPGVVVTPAPGTGGGCAGNCPPMLDPRLLAHLAWLMKGGFQGDGLGSCSPYPNPPVPIGADGCPEGRTQCLQPLPVRQAGIAAAASATITVPVRSLAVPREFLYTGAAATFTIDSVSVNGVDYLNGAIPAERYAAAIENRAVDWGPGFSSTTPMTIVVTNISGATAAFDGVLDASVDR